MMRAAVTVSTPLIVVADRHAIKSYCDTREQVRRLLAYDNLTPPMRYYIMSRRAIVARGLA